MRIIVHLGLQLSSPQSFLVPASRYMGVNTVDLESEESEASESEDGDYSRSEEGPPSRDESESD